MRTSECSVIKELPETFNLTLKEERNKVANLGETIATKEGLHYEGYLAYTEAPYSVEKAKLTLLFN